MTGLVIGGALQFLLERDGLATLARTPAPARQLCIGAAATTTASDTVFDTAPGSPGKRAIRSR